MMWDCLTKKLKIKLVYTEKPSADVFWLITISNTVDLQVSDILMLLTQITTRLADLLNFRGGGRNYSQTAFYSQTRSSVPPKNTLMNLLFKSWIRC